MMPRIRRPVARVNTNILAPGGKSYTVEICPGREEFGEEVATYPKRKIATEHARVINEAIRWDPSFDSRFLKG